MTENESSKARTSISVDREVKERLDDRDDLNVSGAVNSFLREFLASGHSDEAALAVRLEQLDAELADKRKEVEQLERERERVASRLEERRSDLNEELDEMEQKVRNGEFPRENVTPGNAAIQTSAARAQVSERRFVDELEARLGPT